MLDIESTLYDLVISASGTLDPHRSVHGVIISKKLPESRFILAKKKKRETRIKISHDREQPSTGLNDFCAHSVLHEIGTDGSFVGGA